jgi:hypothetical protein
MNGRYRLAGGLDGQVGGSTAFADGDEGCDHCGLWQKSATPQEFQSLLLCRVN